MGSKLLGYARARGPATIALLCIPRHSDFVAWLRHDQGSLTGECPILALEATANHGSDGAIIVVGTKSDLYDDLRDSGKGSDGQPLKTIDQMFAMASEVGAHVFICTSGKTGYGTLPDAEEGPAVDADPDTMSGQGEQYLGDTGSEQYQCLILKFAKLIQSAEEIAKLVTSLSAVCPQ